MQPQERNNWYIQNESKIKKIKDQCNYDAKVADRHIKYCTYCGECWDTKTKKNIRDFVSYGMEKKKCPQCKGKESLCLSLI